MKIEAHRPKFSLMLVWLLSLSTLFLSISGFNTLDQEQGLEIADEISDEQSDEDSKDQERLIVSAKVLIPSFQVSSTFDYFLISVLPSLDKIVYGQTEVPSSLSSRFKKIRLLFNLIISRNAP